MTRNNPNEPYSIVPSTGVSSQDFDMQSDGAIPASFSAGGWTYGNEGFIQQSFLGASIMDFSVNGGFGTSSSSLNANLVNDEYNTSDKYGLGQGDDPYHDGTKDLFSPPQVGAPVFFKFGKNHCTIDEAWRPTFDSVYGYTTIDPNAEEELKEIGKGGIPSVNIIPNTSNEDDGLEVLYSGVWGLDLDGNELPAPEDVLFDATSGNNYYVDKSDVLDPKNRARGKDHFIFGGILQSYTQNRGGNGNPVFATTVTDPREILSNVILLLDNYAGTTYNNPNMLNLYGFLEHNPSDTLFEFFKSNYDNVVAPNGNPFLAPSTISPVTRYGGVTINTAFNYGGHLRKIVNTSVPTTPVNESTERPLPLFQTGEVRYEGNDMWAKGGTPSQQLASSNLPPEFPITGIGMSRRSEEGMPFYRIAQAIRSLFNYDGELPQEYIDAGYGGAINFRGFNYVVDLTGFPADKIPPYYRLNFDKMTLMELCQELADVISHDLYVTLLPVLDHPASAFIYGYNEKLKAAGGDWKDKFISGIIRVDVIDRSKKPDYGSIQKFIDEQTERGEEVQNSDVGYELSNVVTDKFVVGAQESKLYFFSNNRDRDALDVRKFKAGAGPGGGAGDAGAFNAVGDQWKHWKSLQQQIIPFYGFLGKDAVTIPRGWGAYQQIMLDATSLNAAGVGNYYVATELELRAASVSYDRWKDFLLRYNDEYMHSMEEDDALERTLLQTTPAIPQENRVSGVVLDSTLSNNYGVSVPRCVFTSDRNYFTQDGLPASPCSPPLGYPLYYKRATKVGIPEAGITRIHNSLTNLITNVNKLKAERNDADLEIQNAHHEMERIDSEIQYFLASQRPQTDPATEVEDQAIYPEGLHGLVSWVGDKAKELYAAAAEHQKQIEELMELRSQQGYDDATGELVTGIVRKSAIETQIGLIKKAVDGRKDLFTRVSKLHKKAVANSKKIYDFVRGVADKHLGKTFLVKIPKDTNVFYRDDISFSDYGADTNYVGQIQTGPFGFKPEPIDANNPTQYFSKSFQTLMRSIAVNSTPPAPFDYLRARTVDKTNLLGLASQGVTITERRPDYSDGALKCNFDQIDDKWVFNYEIDTNGGWFDHQMCPKPIRLEHINEMLGRNLGINRLPYVTQNILFPKDMYNFIEGDGRVKAYARYNHSQHLNFHGISKDKMTQQQISWNGHLMPVMLDELDNMMPDKFVSLRSKNKNAPEMTAFVKVDVDAKLYMAPRAMTIPNSPVFGTNVLDIGGYVPPQAVLDSGDCKYKLSYGFYEPIYVPHPKKGGFAGVVVDHIDFQRTYFPELNGDIINTEPHSLDPDAVYALITIPGRVKPTIDSRMQDGPNQIHGTQDMKSMLTQDVVKNFPGFERPTMRGAPKGFVGAICNQLSAVSLNQAINAAKAQMKGAMLDDPYRKLGIVTESPVFPDIVAIPLRSKERCYGPWISSAVEGQQIRYKNIGGKVDFKKDEKLAPWNFGGYDLMNQAGVLEAQFSNSLLLFSERGGIVFAGAPRGNTLCQQLVNGGPLVTSISVNVGEGGVSTTYKMDLYTSRFGKLDQQKRGEIDKASRERQKIMDTRNQRIRKGLDKSASSFDFGLSYNQYGNIVDISSNSTAFIGQLDETQKAPNSLVVASINTYNDYTANAAAAENGGAGEGNTMNFNAVANGLASEAAGAANTTTRPQAQFSTSVMNQNKFTSNASVYQDSDEFNSAYYNSAGGDLSQNMVPMSEDAYHPNMPNKERRKQNSVLYGGDNIQDVVNPVPGLPTAGAQSNSDAPASAGMLGGQSAGGFGAGSNVPDDIIGQVDGVIGGIVGSIAEMAAWGSMGIAGLSAGISDGFAGVNDGVDQLNDLFN